MSGISQGLQTIDDALAGVRLEVTSVRVMSQIALILLAAAISARSSRRCSAGAATLPCVRWNWPPLLRLWVQLFIANLGLVIFALLLVAMRPACCRHNQAGPSSSA